MEELSLGNIKKLGFDEGLFIWKVSILIGREFGHFMVIFASYIRAKRVMNL